jgi:hypothetical protein
MKKQGRDLDNVVVSIRLRGDEAVRYWGLMDLAKARNFYANLTDVWREVIGLDKPNLLTFDEIHWFRTGKKRADQKLFGVGEVIENKDNNKDADADDKKRRKLN